MDQREYQVRIERMIQQSAGEEGLSVVGFYHSHPDASARPSEFDRSRAWPFYSYIIISILNRDVADLTSWQFDDQTKTFVRQDLIKIG